MASLNVGMGAIERLASSRSITRHCAEEVLAQCAEDLSRLARRLRLLDQKRAAHNV
jgi:hypothetical protein